MPTPETNQINLFSMLGGSVAVIFALVGVIHNRMTKTQENQQDQLDDGDAEFTANKVELAKLKENITSIREWLHAAELKVKELEDEYKKMHDLVLVWKNDHDRNHPK